MRVTYACLVRECDGTLREFPGLQARVTELESQAQASHITAMELADELRERDRYQVLPQSVAAQVQGLQDGYADIISYAPTGE